MSIQNLEPLCARYGRRIITGPEPELNNQENTVTRALCVLAENGLYAMCVYLVSCKQKDYGEKVLTQHLAGLWAELGLIKRGRHDKNAMLTAVREQIAEHLPSLILARKVTENALVFARYHAKAEITCDEKS